MCSILCFIIFIHSACCQLILPEQQQFNSPQFLPQSGLVLAGIPLQGPLQNVVIAGNGPHVSITVLGQQCTDNFTCVGIPNAYCSSNKTCQCAQNFVEDKLFSGACRLAPGYNEVCNRKDLQCRTPFTCNATGLCDCAKSFIQEFFQCIKDCPEGEIPIGDECHLVKKLDDTCEKHEQCIQTYAQCLHNKCQCIQGANQIKGECVPVSQCPMGEPLKVDNGDGSTQRCNTAEQSADNVCPADYYCLQPDASESNGFCCPKIKMNCPIGKPLDGHNCTTCPWETHHCFSYVIGRFTDTMCCPNACPTSHPIQKDNKCYARSAFDGHCSVDDQCYNVLNAVCRQTDNGNETKCMCPNGNYKYYFGRCLRESNLGEQCDNNEDCKLGSGTQCINNVCSCAAGQIPEPVRNPKQDVPQRCIGEPTCPRSFGREVVKSFTDCSFNSQVCKGAEVCRNWWVAANVTYSLCCPKPTEDDYQAVCSQYNLKISKTGNEPRRCDILPFTQNFFLNEAIKRNEEPTICAIGSSCLLDPFEGNRGICCEPDALVNVSNISTPSTTESHIQTVHTSTIRPKRTTTKAAVTDENLAIENLGKSVVEHSKNYHHNGPVRIITADTFKRVQNKPDN